MNTIGLLLNQLSLPVYPNHSSSEAQRGNKNEWSFFQQLLSMEQVPEEMLLNVESDDINIKELSAKLSNLPLDKLKELYHLLVDNTESVDGINEEEIVDNLVNLIHKSFDNQEELEISFWSQWKAEFQHNLQSNHNHEQPITFFVNPSLEESLKIVQLDQETMKKHFNEVFQQVELLLAKVTDGQDLIKISPRMLELLEKWTALSNKYNLESNQSYVLPSSNLTESASETREQSIWKELIHAFQKRNELATNQQYHINAKVTSKDISKWLQNILNTQIHAKDNVSIQPVHFSNQPSSKLEQYVIYMNQSEAAQSIDRQLIDQFQQVVRTSRFLPMSNGINQLSIALRPDNLGEMMVRFTETNGEMTLKIIVSSQATRQILESNIHQLKNMFSPHQVVIEEREVMIENVNSQLEEQAFDEEKDQSHESNQEESRNSDKEFETEFHEILMNTKV